MNWRLTAIALVIASLFGGALYIRHLQSERVKAEVRAATVAAKATVATETIRILDRSVVKESLITQEAKRASLPILKAEGADALVPPDVATAWRAGIDRMRDGGSPSLSDDDTGNTTPLPTP